MFNNRVFYLRIYRENKMSRAGELAKNTFIITVGRVATQFISFLLLPMYTVLLTSEEYGTVDLITTIVQLLVPIVSLMIDQGTFRFLLSCKNNDEKEKVIFNSICIITLLCLFAFLISIFILPFTGGKYGIWVIMILIMTTYSGLFLQIARGLKSTIDYAVGSFMTSAVTIVLNILFIAYIRMGATGMLVATLGGNFICVVYLFFKLSIFKYTKNFRTDKEICKELLRYSVPLVPNQLSLWVMNSSDRMIVYYFLGASANGILAVSHKFPAIFMTFYNVFLLAWHETGAIHYFDSDRDDFFSEMIMKITTAFVTIGIGIIAVLPIVFLWFVNISYDAAYYNIPIYIYAFFFNIIVGMLGIVYVATKQTIEIAKTTIISAFVNIIVNVALIKVIGLYAASISTFVSYLVVAVYRIIDTKKYLNIKFNYVRIFHLVVVSIMYGVIYYLRNKYISIIGLCIFAIWAIAMNREMIYKAINSIKFIFGKGE